MRNQLVGHFGKTTYYRFYRQEQGLFPKAQAYIRQVFKQYGIAEEPKFERFKFFGSTICYAHLQASGFINDHLTDCICRNQKQ